jgi:predicted NAD/FAD-dependent oxidoreductase
VVKAADFKAKAVGSQVHSGKAGTVLHECFSVAGGSIASTRSAEGAQIQHGAAWFKEAPSLGRRRVDLMTRHTVVRFGKGLK